MKTNYQNLTGFESLVVIFAVVGIVLIGTMIVSSLPEDDQKILAFAVQALDIHEKASRDFASIQKTYGYYDEFLEKFYIAFTELLAVPEKDIAQAQQFIRIGKQASQKILALHPPERGRVLGESISVEKREPMILEIKFDKLSNLLIR